MEILTFYNGEEAVKQSVKILVLTQFFERFQNPYIASNVKYYLFENVDNVTALLIRDEIQRVILNYEPRVNNLTVDVIPNFDYNGFTVNIRFTVINIQIPVLIDLFLERSR